jgi:prepilin-type N-terminal cleavage/methylation domain-containing protein
MNTRKGFTLIELMISVSIIALVAAAVVQTISAIGGASRTDGAVNEIRGYLLMAQQQAVQYNKSTAVWVLPATKFSTSPRLMVFELRPTCDKPSRNISDWQVMAGSYALSLPPGLTIRNGAKADSFPIIFDSQGCIEPPPVCLDADTRLMIGPAPGRESRERPRAVAINRTTGAMMRFERM